MSLYSRTWEPQLLKPAHWRVHSPQQEKPPKGEAHTLQGEYPPLATTEKPMQQKGPSTVKKKQKTKNKKQQQQDNTAYTDCVTWTLPFLFHSTSLEGFQ